MKLICVFVFAYAKNLFSHDAAQIIVAPKKYYFVCGKTEIVDIHEKMINVTDKLDTACKDVDTDTSTLHIIVNK